MEIDIADICIIPAQEIMILISFTFWVGNEYVDFFSCFGLSNIDTQIGKTNFSSFYLLRELHFKLFVDDNTITFLARPALYNDLSRAKRGDNYDFDLNYKLFISVPDFPLGGGVLFNLKSALISGNGNNWSAALAPYVSIIVTGVLWNIFVQYDFAAIQRQDALSGLRFVLSVSTKF